MAVRDQTSDLSVAGSSFGGVAGSPLVDEYGLREITVSGTFWDIGAHIGTVTVAVLLDNPDATAVCVEPIPENLDVLRANLAENGLAERATVLWGAVGTDSIEYGFGGSEVADTNRYIGNLVGIGTGKRLSVPKYTLPSLLVYGEPDLVKIDCEGGEYEFLDCGCVDKLPLIVGEYHGSPDRLRALLALTHEVTLPDDTAPTGLFRAVRR